MLQYRQITFPLWLYSYICWTVLRQKVNDFLLHKAKNEGKTNSYIKMENLSYASVLWFVEKIHARNIKCIPFFTPLPSFLFLVVSCFCAACLREEFGGWGPFCLIAYLRVFSVWCMLAWKFIFSTKHCTNFTTQNQIDTYTGGWWLKWKLRACWWRFGYSFAEIFTFAEDFQKEQCVLWFSDRISSVKC